MHDITILQGPVNIPAGALLKLNPDQARRRAGLVEPMSDDGVYRSVTRVQFKTGEKLSVDIEIPKGWIDRVAVSAPKNRGKGKASADIDE